MPCRTDCCSRVDRPRSIWAAFPCLRSRIGMGGIFGHFSCRSGIEAEFLRLACCAATCDRAAHGTESVGRTACHHARRAGGQIDQPVDHRLWIADAARDERDGRSRRQRCTGTAAQPVPRAARHSRRRLGRSRLRPVAGAGSHRGRPCDGGSARRRRQAARSLPATRSRTGRAGTVRAANPQAGIVSPLSSRNRQPARWLRGCAPAAPAGLHAWRGRRH